MALPLLQPVQHWHCPNCGKRDTTHEARPHTRMHPCPKLRMLIAPMLANGVAGKVELVERQDYIGREQVQLDPVRGRPVQSIVTTRDEGQDVVVFAPTATVRHD